MGQYHILVNLSKKQFVHPHQIGNGLKLLEQVGWDYSTATVLTMLVSSSNNRGGGDFNEHKLVGSWAGDKIAFVGDYSEDGDIKGYDTKALYEICRAVATGAIPDNLGMNEPVFRREVKKWKNISPDVRDMMSKQFNIAYVGDGWLDIKKNK